jgi:hypothetical protein
METHIRIHRTDFHIETLKSISLDEAKERFKHISERTVEAAWKECNPRRKRKKKSVDQ